VRPLVPARSEVAVAFLLATALLTFAGCASTGAGTPSTTTLEAGPGSGFLTSTPSYLKPLRDGVTTLPILTVGDTLVAARPQDSLFVFFPRPDGIAARSAGNGLIELYVAHELEWEDGAGYARVSRLVLNQRSGGVLNADFLLDGTERYADLAALTLVGSREGFLGPTLLVNETSIDSPRHGVAAALEVRPGVITDMPHWGRFRHAATAVLQHSSGSVMAIETEEGLPGESQLYMYLGNSASDLVSGRGRLYVLRADDPRFGMNTRYASMASRSRPLTGRFVLCDNPNELAYERQAQELENRAQQAGCLNFVRLAGLAIDPDHQNAFYFTDLGYPSPADPSSGRAVTGKGRLYRLELDPIDPTRVTSLEVILDGDQGDDIYRPDGIATSGEVMMIAEDPRERGLHAARVLRFDTLTRQLDPIAVCAERDVQGRLLPQGTGGAWEATGITDASDLFGDGSWLVAVQAPTDWSTPFHRIGGGQLLLLRAPGSRR
jgi:hypothetical protein